MIRHVFLFSLIVSILSVFVYWQLAKDLKVHIKLIAQFENDVKYAEQMPSGDERLKALQFTQGTLYRLRQNQSHFFSFRAAILWIAISACVSAILSGIFCRFRLPKHTSIWAATTLLLLGFLPIKLYELAVEYVYDASNAMLQVPYVLLCVFEIIFIRQWLVAKDAMTVRYYKAASLVLGILLLLSIVIFLLMMSSFQFVSMG